MCTKNAKNASAFVSALRDDLSTLEAYRNGVSEIVGNYPDLRDKYNLEDIRDLKSLLVRLTYAGPSKKGLKRTERKLKEMVRAISSVEEAETSRWPWCYLHQYEEFLYYLLATIGTEIFFYPLRNLAILRGLYEPPGLAD